MSKLPPKEVERLLGVQYAEVIARAPQPLRQECKDIINNSLEFMEHANRVALTLQGFRRKIMPAPPVPTNNGAAPPR
jgi:hypothetical protein